MFYNDFKNKAIAEHEKASKTYIRIYKSFDRHCNWLYKIRLRACHTIESILILINSIANKPKDFITHVEDVKREKQKFLETEKYQKQADNSLTISSVTTVVGIGVGTVIATTASSAFAGPIGLGIGTVTAAASILKLAYDNKKIGVKAMKETEKLKGYTQEVKIGREKVITIRRKVFLLNLKLRLNILFMNRLMNANYSELSEKNKLRLGTLVNNTLTLTHLVNEKIG